MGDEKEAGDEKGLVYRAIEINRPDPRLLLRLTEVLRGSNGRQEKVHKNNNKKEVKCRNLESA